MQSKWYQKYFPIWCFHCHENRTQEVAQGSRARLSGERGLLHINHLNTLRPLPHSVRLTGCLHGTFQPFVFVNRLPPYFYQCSCLQRLSNGSRFPNHDLKRLFRFQVYFLPFYTRTFPQYINTLTQSSRIHHSHHPLWGPPSKINSDECKLFSDESRLSVK